MRATAEKLESQDACPYCGEAFTKIFARQITCGADKCCYQRKIERMRTVPEQLERNRQRNRDWCAENRGVHTRNPWLLGPPPFAEHLPGGGFELHVTPAPKWPIELRNTRALHGMVTNLLGRPHEPSVPTFSLVPWPRGVGWGVYTQYEDDARSVAGREHGAVLFDRNVHVRCGPLNRLRAPVIAKRGRRVVRIDAITPVLIRNEDKAHHGAPSADNIASTLCAWLPRRLGLEIEQSDVPMRLVERATVATALDCGGKLGTARGWTGSITVETNAIGHWLLEVSARIGMGGRCAYGFGRVRVNEVG